MNKKIVLISAAAVCIAGLLIFNSVTKTQNGNVVNDKNFKSNQDATVSQKNNINNIEPTADNSLIAGIQKVSKLSQKEDDNSIVKTNLYNDTPSSAIPLSAIAEIALLPENVTEIISDISKKNNIYMVQKHKEKLLIISDNPENIRHGIEFTEITVSNGHQIKTTLGYSDKMNDSQNDVWAYSPDTNQPVKHIKYNSEGDIDFVEEWNYDSDNPVKYEMKDSNGNIISMRKETLTDGTDLRVEHLIYDKDGNTKVNVSATFEGDDIKRFTYYNADNTNESGSIFSDYTDGVKTKETVYTSDLKVKNTYTSDYKDGNRENIIIFDNKNNEIKKYVPENQN